MQKILLYVKVYSISWIEKDKPALRGLVIGALSGSYIQSYWNLSESKSGWAVSSTYVCCCDPPISNPEMPSKAYMPYFYAFPVPIPNPP